MTRRLIFAALCAGLLCGGLAGVAHQVATVPLIEAAEAYEPPAAHEHADAAWAPENGVERIAATLAADLLMAIGFALLLAAGLAASGAEGGWREGLFWGLAGFAVFTLAPGLELPPEIPGSLAGPLELRQLWWLAIVTATASGLALLLLAKHPFYAALGALLIAAPHLCALPTGGVPPPGSEALAHRFVVTVSVVSFLFWTALGAATGYFYRAFAPSRRAPRSARTYA